MSVSDKSGLEEFLSPLVRQGLELVSTGGTAEFLKSKGFKVEEVKDLTTFPEVFSGRVKTLHPHIHMPLLARDWVDSDQKTLRQYGLKPFDLVIGSLYPFETKSVGLEDKELVEWIDVGGPSFLRAAGKNYFSITVVCDTKDYPMVQKGTDLVQRKQLAAKLFDRLSHYDSVIAKSLSEKEGKAEKKDFTLKTDFFKKLRYGENPHQSADWFIKSAGGLHSAEILQGKELSYNNLLDFQTAVLIARDFKEPFAVAVKHNNPCGAALASDIATAVAQAVSADPSSVFGALLAVNRPLDLSSVQKWKGLFLEGIIAPDFSSSALELLKERKNLRVLKWPDMLSAPLPSQSVYEVFGGLLVQKRDQLTSVWPDSWKVVGSSPSEELKKNLLFAWKLCAHLKSNAIAVTKGTRSLGLGMGQVSRISAVRLALDRLREFHPDQKKDLILASDAFFPFPDSIELAGERGVSWIIQPGGSIRDEQVLEKARQLKIQMVLTGQRHFRH